MKENDGKGGQTEDMKRIETERLVIRDLERKEQEQLYKIVWPISWMKSIKDMDMQSIISSQI